MSDYSACDFSKLTEYLDSLDATLGIPACGVAVMIDHETVYSHYSGYADRQKTRPAAADDTYWLYSSTKVSTAVAVLQLVEQGLLSLDEALYKYLPEYEHMTVRDGDTVREAKRHITVENLLTMTAGFTYDRDTEPWTRVKQNRNATTRDVIRAHADDPLAFDPGEQYYYSLAFDVLGALIEVVSGKDLETYFQEYIARPLGMTDTTHIPTPDQIARLSEQYKYVSAERSSKPLAANRPTYVTDKYLNGGGGLLSTVEDYLLLADALANGGVGKSGARILTEASIDNMITNRLVTANLMEDYQTSPVKRGYGYGLGVRVHMDPKASGAKSPVGEFGWNGAAGHYLLSDMKTRLAICFAMHVKNCRVASGVIQPSIRDLVYEALEL